VTFGRVAAVEVPQIGVDELERRREGTFVLDVRQPDEYEGGHVPGARLIPLAEIPDRVGELPSGEPLLVICRTGGRSQRAAEFLQARGIEATNVAGGTRAWIEAGGAVVTGPDPG
jgi:rhodanese-related sulfurtransferase